MSVKADPKDQPLGFFWARRKLHGGGLGSWTPIEVDWGIQDEKVVKTFFSGIMKLSAWEVGEPLKHEDDIRVRLRDIINQADCLSREEMVAHLMALL